MTLKQQTSAALAGLGTTGGGPTAIHAADGRLRLVLELTALESLACEFTRLAIETDLLAGASGERLRQIADRLAGRVTYLLEAISPIELDQERCVVQLRSHPPQKAEDAASYYELLVERGGRLSLRRYEKAIGQPRTEIPVQVTREVLLRLVGDFEAALLEA